MSSCFNHYKKIKKFCDPNLTELCNFILAGTGIFLTAHTTTGCIFGAIGVGRKGKPAAQVAQEAADQLIKSVQELGCVDEFLQDQVMFKCYICRLLILDIEIHCSL